MKIELPRRRHLALLVAISAIGAVAAVPAQAAPPVDLLTQSDITLTGAGANQLTGSAVAAAGDVNGDGIPDIAIGAPFRDGFTGVVFVIFGQSLPTAVDLGQIGTAGNTQGYRINGASTVATTCGFGGGEGLGTSLATAGDMNGDGKADLVIGAPNHATDNGCSAGRVYVLWGKASTTTIDLQSLTAKQKLGYYIDGPGKGSQGGASVAAVGDLNGDGKPEIVFGAPGLGKNRRSQSGSVFVVWGQSAKLKIVSRNIGQGNSAPGFRIDGARDEDGAGVSVAAGPDENGDGLGDILIGAPGNNPIAATANTGSAYVVFGQSALKRIDLAAIGSAGYVLTNTSGTTGDNAGSSVAFVGDLNGDGISDLAIGAPDANAPQNNGAGKVFVVYGKSDTLDEDVSTLGANGDPRGYLILGAHGGAQVGTGDRAGAAVAGAGDVNGDGVPDLLVGAPQTDNFARENAGSVDLVYGQATAVAGTIDLAAIQSGNTQGIDYAGAVAGDKLGTAVSGLGANGAGGSIDGNATPDLLFGAPQPNGSNGEAFIQTN